MGVPIASGLRFLLDGHQRFWRAGLPVFLRVQNFAEPTTEAAELGFQYSPSGNQTGFTDIKISPPPEVTEVSMHNIGLNQTRLQFGAKTFRISHTWVTARRKQKGYDDDARVFRDVTVLGIFYDSRLFSIESVTHDDVGGETILWNVVCNSDERKVTAT